MDSILERLRRGDVIVADGALGTMLMKRGLKHGDPPEEFNLSKQSILEEIAALYLDAGAEIISANTFGASPLRLKQFSLEQQTEAINQNAVNAVRRAVRDRAYISGSVGPSSLMIKPLGDAEPEEVFSSYQRQMIALLAAGIDLICIETMMDVAEAKLAIEAARSLNPNIPVMATMTFGKTPQGYRTLMGSSIENAAAALEKAGANIVGSNCGDGMENMVGIAREFRQYAQVPVAIQGNAGLPAADGTNLIYPETPEFVAEKAKELLQLGVQIIGGCCGTQPEHIRAIRNVVDARLKK
jgi:5-methyltetrahydrofolate--homocysteine methyltransferase